MFIIHLIKLEVLMVRALFFLNQDRKIPSSITYVTFCVAERDSHLNYSRKKLWPRFLRSQIAQ